ncbi:ubiquitin-specific protease YUH1 [Cyberlindnera jadinii NRRL Y-1542]|uniref:Ubiquitin carboxyl-terminal hydrolase n=1 Tax=Cyberlindnera jadinii (strain ATCC 18201 / CBS 1600 / BCRC 20928 / JCM 3617 / NBRC 0987 / NRRL Y-1542) TaxID=983966 RepID=A0A1E4RX15_CYBJN|nr:cysteine proteinase [Cyberlindnera jadinii NRRL Y-1542]ODV71813.1 cysteine proteinase [Cyberlindnera jadinii NRRL Y-1542]
MARAVIPLESNPEIFSTFAHNLGLSQKYSFHDVYSLTDKDLLSFIPRPCQAIIMLFPVTEAYESVKDSEESSRSHDANDVIWFKQTVKNACGLYALLNSISNLDDNDFESNSTIAKFKLAHNNTGKVEHLIDELERQYTDIANQGETDAPDANDDVSTHFIAFIKKNGHLYELDGRRQSALDLGQQTNDGDVLEEPGLAQRFQHYVDLTDEANKNNFSLMALAPSFD